VSIPDWSDYLDGLEDVALAVRADLLEGRSPVVPAIVQPAGPLPTHLQARQVEVAALVDDVAAFLAQHQNAVAERLGALPHPAARSTDRPAGSLGERVDIHG
jgi:hypothetical protein